MLRAERFMPPRQVRDLRHAGRTQIDATGGPASWPLLIQTLAVCIVINIGMVYG